MYGVANLEKPLTRAGVYLPDGLYASIVVGSADKPMTDLKQLMVSVDYQGAPIQAANFVRIVEGKTPPAAGGRGGAAGFGGAGGRGGNTPPPPPIGNIQSITGGFINVIVLSEIQKSVMIAKPLPKVLNPSLKHDVAGVFGVSSNNTFYLTTEKNAKADKKFTALGKVVGGLGELQGLKKGDVVRAIRITRVGEPARNFKTDDEAFNKLLATKKK